MSNVTHLQLREPDPESRMNRYADESIGPNIRVGELVGRIWINERVEYGRAEVVIVLPALDLDIAFHMIDYLAQVSPVVQSLSPEAVESMLSELGWVDRKEEHGD